jgi:hypothetical protein
MHHFYFFGEKNEKISPIYIGFDSERTIMNNTPTENRKKVCITIETHKQLVALCKKHGYKIQSIADWVLREYLSKEMK